MYGRRCISYFAASIRKARVKIFSKERIVSSNNDGENLILEVDNPLFEARNRE